MKNTLIVVLLAAMVALGGLFLLQKNRAGRAEANLQAVQKDAADLQSRLESQKEGANKLQQRLEDVRQEADIKAVQITEMEQALTNRPPPAARTNKESNPFAGMFKSPEMRELIKNQQKAFMGTTLERQYADFFSNTNLTTEQVDGLRELITKKMVSNMDAGMEMMGEDADAARRAEIAKQIKDNDDQINDEIKQLLGEDAYAEFKAYEKLQPERQSVNQFKEQLGSGANALTADQQQQLMQAMAEERKGFTFTTDYADKSKFDGDFSSYFSEDRVNQFVQEQERLNQQYLNRARTFLTADQMTAYEKFLTAQQEMQKAGMQMAAKMFSTQKGGN